MREILFRGKRLDKGYWVCGGNLIHFADNEHVYLAYGASEAVAVETEAGFSGISSDDDNTLFYDIDPDTVGQYTGFTDKNGKNIFEGDIVKATFDDDEFAAGGEGIGAVYFAYGQWYVCGELQRSLHDLNCEYYIEIIGNIHDNPELMEA